MWTYNTLERALAATYGVDEKNRTGPFRGRLKHFQRLGVPLGRRPGRGSKNTYDAGEALQLLLCFELSGFAIDPTVAHAFLEARSQDVLPGLVSNFEGEPDAKRYFVFRPDQATRTWSGDPTGNLGSFEYVDGGEVPEIVERIGATPVPRVAIVDVRSATSRLRSHLGMGAPRRRDVLLLSRRRPRTEASGEA